MQLTQEAKIASDFFFIRAIFAVVGFVSALKRLPPRMGQEALFRGERDSVNPCGWRAPPHGAGAYHHTGSSEKLGTVPVSAPPVTRQVSVSPLRYVWIVTLPAPV